jgi:hypothetical protein
MPIPRGDGHFPGTFFYILFNLEHPILARSGNKCIIGSGGARVRFLVKALAPKELNEDSRLVP